MGTKFVLASLAPLVIQLLYLQKLFVISCLFMQRVENNKMFYLALITRKHLLLLRRDQVCTKRTLATEYLDQMQINRFLGNTENIQACYEKLFHSVSI